MKLATKLIYFFILPYLAVASNLRTSSRQSITSTRAYDPLSKQETCYNPISEADADGDGQLSKSEYTEFVTSQISSNVSFATAQELRKLAFELQVTFVYLDCMCGSGESGNCCDDFINIGGANPDDTPTDEQLAHLDDICGKTQSAIDTVGAGNVIAPTDPTASPITFKPSFKPTSKPTRRPTPNPTANPVASPSQKPTRAPSENPTEAPTSKSPSSLPTIFQAADPTTDGASPDSTESPTASPKPSNPTSQQPSSLPSLSQVPSSTSSPTLTSTQQPSSEPSKNGNDFVVDNSEGDDSERDGGETQTESSNNTTIILICVAFPLIAIIAAGICAITRKRRREEEIAKRASLEDGGADEKVVGSRGLPDLNDDVVGSPVAAHGVRLGGNLSSSSDEDSLSDVDDVELGVGRTLFNIKESESAGDSDNSVDASVTMSDSKEDLDASESDISETSSVGGATESSPRGGFALAVAGVGAAAVGGAVVLNNMTSNESKAANTNASEGVETSINEAVANDVSDTQETTELGNRNDLNEIGAETGLSREIELASVDSKQVISLSGSAASHDLEALEKLVSVAVSTEAKESGTAQQTTEFPESDQLLGKTISTGDSDSDNEEDVSNVDCSNESSARGGLVALAVAGAGAAAVGGAAVLNKMTANDTKATNDGDSEGVNVENSHNETEVNDTGVLESPDSDKPFSRAVAKSLPIPVSKESRRGSESSQDLDALEKLVSVAVTDEVIKAPSTTTDFQDKRESNDETMQIKKDISVPGASISRQLKSDEKASHVAIPREDPIMMAAVAAISRSSRNVVTKGSNSSSGVRASRLSILTEVALPKGGGILGSSITVPKTNTDDLLNPNDGENDDDINTTTSRLQDQEIPISSSQLDKVSMANKEVRKESTDNSMESEENSHDLDVLEKMVAQAISRTSVENAPDVNSSGVGIPLQRSPDKVSSDEDSTADIYIGKIRDALQEMRGPSAEVATGSGVEVGHPRDIQQNEQGIPEEHSQNNSRTASEAEASTPFLSDNVGATDAESDVDSVRRRVEAFVRRSIPKEIDNLDLILKEVERRENEPLSELEIRARIVALITSLLPNEIDNIENVLKQFEGREDELLWTLETMEANQRQIHEGAEIVSDSESTLSQLAAGIAEPHEDARAFLKSAIERGDWHAVGRAAAIMGRDSTASIASANTESSAISEASNDSRLTLYLDKEDRIKHLDDLITKGDWISIVILAGQYQAMDEDEDLA